MNDEKISKSKFYPYLATIIVTIYITTQFLTIITSSNVGVMLEEISKKQKAIFEFLIRQSIEDATNTSTYPNILEITKNDKDTVLKLLSYNKTIKVYDITIFDVNGELVVSGKEDISQFNYVVDEIKKGSIIDSTVGNIRYSEFFEDRVIDILVPIFENGKMVAIMCQTESFERINFALKEVSILETGETYIVDKDGVVLTDLKKEDIIKGDIKISEEVKSLNINGFVNGSYKDYKGVNVYGYHSKLGVNNWRIITEIDENEVKNVSTNLNTFVISSVSLVLALSKILEPIIEKTKTQKSIKNKNKIYLECIDVTLNKDDKLWHFKICYIKLRNLFVRIINIYKEKSSIINICLTLIIVVSSVFLITKIKIDNDIQKNLDQSNKINNRMVGYYINELEATIYSMSRILNEIESFNKAEYIKRIEENNKEILNTILLDEENNIVFNSNNKEIDKKVLNEILESNNFSHRTSGVSKIYFDNNSYVFYITSKILEHESGKYLNLISELSFDYCAYILENNELYPTRTTSILLDNEIIFSTKYKNQDIQNKNYEILSNNLNKIKSNNQSIFNIKTYKNKYNEKSYFSFINVDTKDIELYSNYSIGDKIQWKILYEEEINVARKRILDYSLNLCLKFGYEYIEKMISMII